MKKIVTLGIFLSCTVLMACTNINTEAKQNELLAMHDGHGEKHQIKVALLLDTSNSMDGLINQAKAQLWEIVNELSYAKCGTAKPDLAIALYEYGNDDLSSREGYIRQVLGFSDDLDEISEKLFSLTTHGGSEYCGQVIQTSLNQLNWGDNKDGDLKMIFIAGNEPFTQGTVNYKDAASNANEKDVVVNTIFCGDYNQGISGMWRDGATLTNGDYMTINHNEAIVHIATPYDKIIIELNTKLNGTYISYGSLGYAKSSLQAQQDDNAAGMHQEVAVKRAVSKSSRMYKNSTWDLVDAEKEADFDYGKLKKDDLPKELKGKSTAQIKTYVAKKRAEREKIQKEIQELNKKREAYIAKERKNGDQKNLDKVMIEAIKKQAAKKKYTW